MDDAARDDITRPGVLGPALVRATGDERWARPVATLIDGGRSNLTFLLASPDPGAGELILRRPPTGDLLPSAHDMAREARVQRALRGTDVPVAEIVLEDDGGLLGVPCYVMEKVDGVVVRADLPAPYLAGRTVAEAGAAMTDGLVATLLAIHSADINGALAAHGRPDGFLERQLRRWGRQWEASRDGDGAVPDVDALGAALRDRLPAGRPAGLVHGDFRFDNCLLDAARPGPVRAVLDWEMSTLGDPLTDLALLLFYWTEPEEVDDRLVPSVTVTPGFPRRADVVERYAAARPVDHLGWYLAFAHWKSAIIVQGVVARAKAGKMAGQDFGDRSAEVARIAARGLRTLREEH